MSQFPAVSSVYTNQGGVECMIGERGKAVPITIDGTRLGAAAANVTVAGPSLFARRTASPYKAVPYMNSGAITSPGNTTNAVVDVPDADAARFKVGDACTYYTISSGAYYATETKAISAITAAGGGTGGAGFTKITFTGTWTTPPAGSSVCLLVVSDGAQLSENVVVVLEDVVFNGTNDIQAAGFTDGLFVKAKVNNTTYFDQSKNQTIKLVNMV